ncbi:hypothetical protein KP509_1Z114100 [Ceratopteris richardii]|nr:hypothetical protein KP509_1Z241200 [Ceratopteris richardii]KAH6555608.1 hypothetical protein KP509_1Z241300 [Ceratopteris richardii]KAH6557127.1 hypothetical protein KP509_1Z132700 [Ceratopteris richardii]KAH6557453.1 hypothetical protein KP509_1Z113800 [Ceratopteris richardii]KAH6557456.1 hypothetical protein KP509_1Z114100 [Ceratopteris richardii]
MAPQDVHQHEDCPPSAARATTSLCIENCGFYGTAENGGRCSACFKKVCISKGTSSTRPVSEYDGTCSPTSACASLLLSRSALHATPNELPLSPRTFKFSATDANSYELPFSSPSLASTDSDAACYEIPCSSPPSKFSASDARSYEISCRSQPSTSSASDAKCFPSAPSCALDKTKPNRCFSCRRRVGLAGFKCRCGNLFCPVHRYSEEHNCTFDYKAKAKKEIAANNPIVKPPKIHKI